VTLGSALLAITLPLQHGFRVGGHSFCIVRPTPGATLFCACENFVANRCRTGTYIVRCLQPVVGAYAQLTFVRRPFFVTSSGERRSGEVAAKGITRPHAGWPYAQFGFVLPEVVRRASPVVGRASETHRKLCRRAFLLLAHNADVSPKRAAAIRRGGWRVVVGT
jgi:hypothetical protein